MGDLPGRCHAPWSNPNRGAGGGTSGSSVPGAGRWRPHLKRFRTGQKPIGHGIIGGGLDRPCRPATTPETTMSDQGSIRELLKRYRAELQGIAPTQADWPAIRDWFAKVRPLFRDHLPNHFSDFSSLAEMPSWRSLPGPWDEHANKVTEQ